MRQIGDLMKDLGFNPDAPEETQKAFIRHLVNTAAAAHFQRRQSTPLEEVSMPHEQLSLDFDAAERVPPRTQTRKQVG